MMRLNQLAIISLILIGVTACADRYDQGYDRGYSAGYSVAAAEYQQKLNECEREALSDSYNYVPSRTVRTEVCGGGGVTFNGKHYSPGSTGCVRIYSDGTVKRY